MIILERWIYIFSSPEGMCWLIAVKELLSDEIEQIDGGCDLFALQSFIVFQNCF